MGPDGVLFAKNSDRDPNESQALEWHPARVHSSDSTVRCTWIEIPQVEATHAVLISRPFWMWGAEMGVNEHQVAIGNEAVFTNQAYADRGLTGMDLLRLALERGATAREAVDVIIDLLDRHGQGGGCGHEDRSFTYHNSFICADPGEAYVVETAGRHWEVEAVGSGARSISNGLTIPGFADRFSDRLKTSVSRCRIRQPLTQRRAGAARDPHDLMDILRDHGGTEPRYRVLNGAMAAPCMHAGGLATGSQTTASLVAHLAGGGRTWATGTAAPCTSVFKPVSVGAPIDLGPAPTDRFGEDSLWWRHERFHRRVMRDPATGYASFWSERADLERTLVDVPSSAAFELAEEAVQRWASSLPPVDDGRPGYVRRYWSLRDRRAGLL